MSFGGGGLERGPDGGGKSGARMASGRVESGGGIGGVWRRRW
jgi:hypothetical protein